MHTVHCTVYTVHQNELTSYQRNQYAEMPMEMGNRIEKNVCVFFFSRSHSIKTADIRRYLQHVFIVRYYKSKIVVYDFAEMVNWICLHWTSCIFLVVLVCYNNLPLIHIHTRHIYTTQLRSGGRWNCNNSHARTYTINLRYIFFLCARLACVILSGFKAKTKQKKNYLLFIDDEL